MRARLVSSSGRFFSPSYLSARSTPRTSSSASSRAISFSSNGSRRVGSGVTASRNASKTSDKVASAPSEPTASASGAAPANPPTVSGAAASATTTSASPIKPVVPLAPTVPHVSRALVGLDAFFSLYRPLLELPVRLHSRRSIAAVASLEHRTAQLDSSLPAHALAAAAAPALTPDEAERGVMRTADGEEIVEVIDLDADGVPTGPSYMATLSAVRAAHEAEDEAGREADSALGEMAESSSDHEESWAFEPWLLGAADPSLTSSVEVVKHLASQQAHVSPPPPRLPVAKCRIVSSPAPALTPLSPQTLSDLSFLQPFRPPTTSASPATATDPSQRFGEPFTPQESFHYAETFLTNSLLAHRWSAFDGFARAAGEKLELAKATYLVDAGQEAAPMAPVVPRRPWSSEHRRGEVRIWSESEGWRTLDLGAGIVLEGPDARESPFLPAEMVDLDWDDDDNLHIIRLDSTKRKRKKKITKHKYKKRRKAQKALRQRLGK